MLHLVRTQLGLLACTLPLVAALAGCGLSGPGHADDDSRSSTGSTQTGPTTTGGGAGAGGHAGGDAQTTSSTATGSGTGGGMISTANVQWISWPTQQSRSNSAWGSALTDIANHLPSSYGGTYDDVDLVTFGHETSHGVHAHLRNYQNTTGKKANAFYVLGDKAALVVEPAIYKSDVTAYVPISLREFRFSTYVTGASAWDDTPLYLWDEWNAYVNGAEVGVNRVTEGLWNEGWRDQSGNLEFVVYAMAVGMAVRDLDPQYFQDYEQFRAFLQWNTERSMALFKQHQAMGEFTSQNVADYHQTLTTSTDADPMRQFVRDTFGAAWAMQTLGF